MGNNNNFDRDDYTQYSRDNGVRDGRVVFNDEERDGTIKLGKKVRRVSRTRKTPTPASTKAIIILAVVFTLFIAASVIVIVQNRTGGDDGTIPGSVAATTAANAMTTDTPVTTAVPAEYVKMSDAKIHTGDLILVNNIYAYIFPENPTVKNVSEGKTASFKRSTTELYLEPEMLKALNEWIGDLNQYNGCADVMLNSCWRDYNTQFDLYQDFVSTYGAEYAASRVAEPGHSEHHSGYAVDFAVFTDKSESYQINEYEPAQWLLDHAAEYGFILRYTEENRGETGIIAEPWHYRYITKPHAMIMKQLEITSFEKYIEMLYNYTWDGDRLLFDGTYVGKSSKDAQYSGGVLIYYVPADGDGETQVPVPKGTEYNISGNNIDGFIVTAGTLD